MTSHPKGLSRSLLILCLLALVALMSACTKSPEEVRAWMRDKRAPVKMTEFIQNKNFKLESKVEAVMVLVERQNSTVLPDALKEPLKTEEINRIVAGVIPRLEALLSSDRDSYETRVKDASYYLLTLEINDENRAALIGFIRDWLHSDNFFLPMEKAGRVEHQRLFEVLGSESLPIYRWAIDKKLTEYDEALAKEHAKEEELKAKGEKYKIVSRPSDTITATLSSTLQSLEALKLSGSNDMAAELFLERIEKTYPNMPRAYVLPFASNPSAKLLPMARRIATDPEYKNVNLNYFKDVMFATYYRNVQKKAGAEVCEDIVKNDRTGYSRWDCMDLLAIERGRDGFAPLIMSIPNDYGILKTPDDHPTLLANPTMTFWNSLRVFCSHLPATFNNQVPLDVFRTLMVKGTTVTRMLSMACLSTVGVESDVALLNTQASSREDIRGWGMQVSTMGELAGFTSALLEKRIAMQKAEAAKPEAAKPEAAKPEAAKPEAAKPDAAKPDAAKPDAAKPDAAKSDETKSAEAPAPVPAS